MWTSSISKPSSCTDMTTCFWGTPRHEKQVADQISRQGIACYLPLYRSVRRWKDRRKELALVLFPGYVFVRMALQHRLRVLQLPGAVRLVTNFRMYLTATQLEITRSATSEDFPGTEFSTVVVSST